MPPPRGARPMNREDFKKNPISKDLIKKLMHYVTGKYRALLGIVVICIIVASVTSVLGNMFIKNLIDDYIVPILKTKTETGAADFSGLLKWIRMVAILFGFGVIANLVQGQVMLIIANKMDLPESQANLDKFVAETDSAIEIFPMSAANDASFNEIKNKFRNLVEQAEFRDLQDFRKRNL